MTESKLLHEYKWTEFPGLIDCISRKQVKLFARITADESTFFIPEEDSEARRKAESGQYEIYDTAPVMSALEETHRQESNSRGGLAYNFNPESIPDFSQDKVELKCVISPDGERGVLGCGSSPKDPLDPMLIPFSRIRVENIPEKGNTESDLEKELAPKSKGAYLRLIGYMVERLAETDSLSIDEPYAAADQILLASQKAGKLVGSKNFISTTIAAAKDVWEDSDTI